MAVSIPSRRAIYRIAVSDLQDLLESCPFKTLYMHIVNYVIIQEDHRYTWDEACELECLERDYALIMETIEKVMECYPRNAWLRCFHARALWSYDSYTKALQELRAALVFQIDYPLALSLLGETYYLLGHYADALCYLDRTLSLTPLNARAYFARALTRDAHAQSTTDQELKRLEYTLALMDIEKAVTLSPHRASYFDSVAQRIRKQWLDA